MLIFVYGENEYLSSKQVDEMRKRFIDKFDSSGMNLAEFDADKIELGDAMQAIATPPFISEKRMVILKGLMSKVTRKEDYAVWIDNLKKTPESTITILFDKENVSKIEKHGLFKGLQDHADLHSYPFPALSGPKLIGWARAYVKQIELNIQDQLLHHVAALVGDDVWQLSLELDKLAAFSNGQPVTQEMVSDLVRANFEDQMFAFVDAVSNGQPKQALKLLDEQRRSGSADFHLLAMLARQIRLLIGARDVLDRNPQASKKDLADAMGVHPFVAQKTLAQARKMNMDQLRSFHNMLFDFDTRLKRGAIAPDVAVDRFVAEMLI